MLHSQQDALLVIPFPFTTMLPSLVMAFPTQVAILPIHCGRAFIHAVLKDSDAPRATVTEIGIPFPLTPAILHGSLHPHLS